MFKLHGICVVRYKNSKSVRNEQIAVETRTTGSHVIPTKISENLNLYHI